MAFIIEKKFGKYTCSFSSLYNGSVSCIIFGLITVSLLEIPQTELTSVSKHVIGQLKYLSLPKACPSIHLYMSFKVSGLDTTGALIRINMVIIYAKPHLMVKGSLRRHMRQAPPL